MTKKITVTLHEEDSFLLEELTRISQEDNRTINKSLGYLAKLGLIVYNIRTTKDNDFKKALIMLIQLSENDIFDLLLIIKQGGF